MAPVAPVTPEPPVADGVLFGPDGMPLINDAVVEQDEDGQLHAQIQSHQKVAAWLSVIWGFQSAMKKITLALHEREFSPLKTCGCFSLFW